MGRKVNSINVALFELPVCPWRYVLSSNDPGLVMWVRLKPSTPPISTHCSSPSTTVFGLPTNFGITPTETVR